MEGVQFLEAWVCLALNYSVLNQLVVSGLFAVSELEEDLDGVFFEESFFGVALRRRDGDGEITDIAATVQPKSCP